MVCDKGNYVSNHNVLSSNFLAGVGASLSDCYAGLTMTYNCKFILPAFLVWSFFDCTGAVAASSKGSSDSICRIEVVEAGSRWPVALVQLTTSSQLRYVTDNAGVIAISDPDLMDRQVFFQVQGHG